MTASTRIAIEVPNAPTSVVVERGAIARLGEVLAASGISVADRRVLLVVDRRITPFGARAAASKSEPIRLGVNTANGHVCNEPVARDLGKNYVEPLVALG